MDCIVLGCFQLSGGKVENSSVLGRKDTGGRREGAGNRRANAGSVFKALQLDWMEQSVVPLEMVFQVWRSYSGKRQ
jgi:hypothetical protein